ncbi:laccase [Coniophora puteana RWD-64-598 SS2]|uniref:Laccase n=1 Tax=Coniophora puteana (strain RWD-64-598) TaxID=741705 RepID=R7SEA0_CONPW|nr:laccase [Coniophora puteana RWD-64-598 SS2]EIW74506.1 laccase [Coniophora puteana RWD-64-598 SS2]
MVLAGLLSCLTLTFHRVDGRRAESSTHSPPTLGPVSKLVISDRQISPDGFPRLATVVNGITPGPLIMAKKGDDFRVTVENELDDPSLAEATSVHWHGIFQHGSSWADGTSFVSQCPLIPDESFTHAFNAQDQAGTYFYHSHYKTQFCDGLRGPLVIYDPEDPHLDKYDVDDENTVITLTDWYHQLSPELADKYAPIISNTTLINGKGRYKGGPSEPLSVIEVEHGKAYRFRVVGMSCDRQFDFSIAEHTMTIIEVDGITIEPVEADIVTVFSGQRYSIVVRANQAVGNYWVRARPPDAMRPFTGGRNSAILRYTGADHSDPASQESEFDDDLVTPLLTPLTDSMIHPLVSPGAPGVPEIGQADVNINFELGNRNGLFTMNNVSFKPPSTPVLLQILNGRVHPSDIMPRGSVYELPLNKTIELSFPTTDAVPGWPHPIHLHGHVFDVVRSAGEEEPNFYNPARRDTVSLGNPGDNVTIRFVTDNVGPWFLHCHNDWHLLHGFAVVLAEGTRRTEHLRGRSDSWENLCPAYSAYGNSSEGALSSLPH